MERDGMMPGTIDHVLAAIVAIAYPAYFAIDWFGRGRRELETGTARARRRFYIQSMIELWLLAPVVLGWWIGSGRTLTTVGLGVSGGLGFWIGAIVVVALVLTVRAQLGQLRASAAAREKARAQLGGTAALMLPRSAGERRTWIALSLTAGICEEVLYRGFLIWYLAAWLPDVAAVFVSSAAFGIAHVYLGLSGVLRATVAGVIFGLAYLLTGSLWVPIALHATVDIASGFGGSIAMMRDEAA
jgi:membrane protease YdiL (CAAX protease family)